MLVVFISLRHSFMMQCNLYVLLMACSLVTQPIEQRNSKTRHPIFPTSNQSIKNVLKPYVGVEHFLWHASLIIEWFSGSASGTVQSVYVRKQQQGLRNAQCSPIFIAIAFYILCCDLISTAICCPSVLLSDNVTSQMEGSNKH